MAKIQLVAVLSIDGCLSDFKTEGSFWIHPQKCGITEACEKAARILTDDDVLYKLEEEHKENNGKTYLAIADSYNEEHVKFIHSLLKRELIDELAIYTCPIIAGTGKTLFQKQNVTYWNLIKHVDYEDGFFSDHYIRIDKNKLCPKSKDKQ